ncbi:nuclear transport factor 2 family protein [Mycolicibacterium sp. S2-37]|uniref:nuclear transport factor 2 family protein n=1 Tax=Mycolicibacterium sp. S2-37 TaxID=2810297 RepID=UPI001A94DC71|nr:nuclear transport factor 2 family protein [Mycolicibacterium sp. S2-37]MBO0676608.1 nuclear transport factor 2 family protein [Mycolicibacterium sp. S2-37]
MSDPADLTTLTAQYCHRFDDGQIDDLLDLFEPDATVDLGGRVSTGHEQLAGFFHGIRKATIGGRHLCVNPEFQVDGDSATGVLDFLLVRVNGDPPTVGRYHDTYRRRDGRWRFAVRQIVTAG